eukprot:UN03970
MTPIGGGRERRGTAGVQAKWRASLTNKLTGVDSCDTPLDSAASSAATTPNFREATDHWLG